MSKIALFICCSLLWLSFTPVSVAGEVKPNIIVILCDDLGIGDVSCFNANGKIATPNIDRLANGGMKFTDAHTSSSVCTPTRYALLTGRYNWRTRLQKGVQGGMSPPLIAADRITIAGMLKKQGYWTACAGKWHLGLGWQLKPATKGFQDGIEAGPAGWGVDFSKPFLNGPTTRGFDSYFGISASLDMVPYTFLRDDRVVEMPTVDKDFPMMLGRANGKTRRGPAAEEFEANQVLGAITDQSVRWIEERAAAANKGEPFFLYIPFASPHTPIVPTESWQNKSGINHYADFVMETDAAVGRIMDKLKAEGLLENTLVFFTSDNGCSDQADFKTLQAAGHDSSAGYRGFKSKTYEGGHRVPLIAHWPAVVPAGTTCTKLVGLQDIYATCASILGHDLEANEAEDSFSFASLLTSPGSEASRSSLVHHSLQGRFSFRAGDWKMIYWHDGGGFGDKSTANDWKESLTLNQLQLFQLKLDPSEKQNVIEENIEVAKRLTAELKQLIETGSSRPNSSGKNDVRVHWVEPKL
jgi:arylsulfatase A